MPAELVVNDEDEAQEVGFGYCYAEMDDERVKHYYAVFIPRIIFGSPSTAYKTRAKVTEYQTPTLEGELLANVSGDFYKETEHASFAAALAHVNTKLGFVE